MTCRGESRSGALIGLVLIAVGAIVLLDQLDLVEIEWLIAELDVYWRYWPLILVGIGVYTLATGGSLLGAALWIAVGGWFQLWLLDVIEASPLELFWPLLLTTLGTVLVYQALTSSAVGGEPDDRFNVVTVWSGQVRRLRTPAFAGGSATAVMGGCEIDLTGTDMSSGEATVHAVAFWGGVEIRVPENWTVVDRIVPILGGTEIEENPLADADRRLVLRGVAVMGAIEVKRRAGRTGRVGDRRR